MAEKEYIPGKLYRLKGGWRFHLAPFGPPVVGTKLFLDGDVFLCVDSFEDPTRSPIQEPRVLNRFLDKDGDAIDTYTELKEGIFEEVTTK